MTNENIFLESSPCEAPIDEKTFLLFHCFQCFIYMKPREASFSISLAILYCSSLNLIKYSNI